jgi:hypothetical protein
VFYGNGPVGAALLYPDERFADALDFVYSVADPRQKDTAIIEEFVYATQSLENLSAAKLCILASRFPAIFTRPSAVTQLINRLFMQVYSCYTLNFGEDQCLEVPGVFRWLCAHANNSELPRDMFLRLIEAPGILQDLHSVDRRRRKHGLLYFLFMLKCIECAVPPEKVAEFWDFQLQSRQFLAINKAILRPIDHGAGDFEQLESAKKRLKTACSVTRVRGLTLSMVEEQKQDLKDQRALLDYMEFVAKYYPKDDE